MTPNPLKGLTTEKRVFNCRLSGMRRILENGIGILANCWRVFRRLNLKKLKMLHLLIIIIITIIIIIIITIIIIIIIINTLWKIYIALEIYILEKTISALISLYLMQKSISKSVSFR